MLAASKSQRNKSENNTSCKSFIESRCTNQEAIVIRSRSTFRFFLVLWVMLPFSFLYDNVNVFADTSQRPIQAGGANFERFRKETDPWIILHDPVIKQRIKALMGNKDASFWACTQLVELPKISGDHCTLTAGVRGLFTIMESVFDLNLSTGKCCCGYLEDGVLHIYGVQGVSELPKPVQDYITAKGFTDTQFDKPDWSPIKTERKPSVRKHLNLASLTGKYERNDASQFSGGSLDVLALPHSKIKFSLSAIDGGHSGGAQGTVPIVNNRASYRQGKSQIEMRFTGPKVVISGNDSEMCAIGVTLLGTYQKTDDQKPQFDF